MHSNLNKNIIVVASLFLISLVNGQNEAVKRLCDATYAPVVCTSCIKTSTVLVNNDADVLQALLKCANTDAQQLLKDTEASISDPKNNPTAKSVLRYCRGIFIGIVGSNNAIKELARQKKYQEARKSIDTKVFQKIGQCSSWLGKFGINIPPKVFSGLFTTEGAYKVVHQALNVAKA